ncbi:MAG: amidase [Bryobacterales bacterium]|nr:amidase [Bryobacterales bacterium]
MRQVPEDVFFAPVTELNNRLRNREFSAADLTRAFCDRLESLGPRYNALALSLRKDAMRQAHDVDGDLKIGRFRSSIQGVPFAVKDLLAVAKYPTTWGAPPYAHQVFDYNAKVVERLTDAGAILIGKLSMVELAGAGGYRYASASLQGPGLNPWDPARWSGGSSSGSAIAVAAGLVPFAVGSETSGSIVTPSAYCGVTGLRPTYGLVSRWGAMALAWTMDKLGPMGRTAADCGHILRHMAGSDSRDPGSSGKSFYYTPQFTREWKYIRAGYAPSDFDQWPAPACRPVFRQALDVLSGNGMTIEEKTLPDQPYGAVSSMIISAEGSAVFEELIESGAVGELRDAYQIAGLKAGLGISAPDYLRAMRIRRVMQDHFRELLAEVDVLISPARPHIATPVAEPLDAQAPKPPAEASGRGMRLLVAAANLAGLPALSVPCGFVDGLPVALQFVGRPNSENLLLALGNYFQQHTDWHRRKPPLV